jgi:hypothetical protein
MGVNKLRTPPKIPFNIFNVKDTVFMRLQRDYQFFTPEKMVKNGSKSNRWFESSQPDQLPLSVYFQHVTEIG